MVSMHRGHSTHSTHSVQSVHSVHSIHSGHRASSVLRAGRALAMGAAVAVASATLVACGGSATVDTDDAAASSIAPLERGSTTASTSAHAPAADGEDQAHAPGNAAVQAPAAPPQPQDRGARELDEAPEPPQRSIEDQDYLDVVADAGVDINGIEDQIIAVGHAACNHEDNVTVAAIAGQLLSQERTELAHEQLVAVLSDNGRAAYCP